MAPNEVVGSDHVGLGLDYVYHQLALVADFMGHPSWVPDQRLPEGRSFIDIGQAPSKQLPKTTEPLLACNYKPPM